MWSLLQGFDVERADMSLIGDLEDAMKRLTKAYVSEDGDVSGAKNFANTLIEDVRNRDTTLGSMGDSLEVALRDSLPVFGWLSSETKADKLYGAIINGDTVYEERLQNSYVGKDGKFDKSA